MIDKRRMKAVIPSAVTLGNLLCGYLAVINVIEGSLTHAAWWVIIAAVFDLLDGKIARMTGSTSLFGVEFDSLADVVSFGIAPAVLFHQYLLVDAGNVGYFMAFIFLAAGAIRLARFNTTATTGKKHHFTGMPIPSAAGILSSFILFSENVWGGLATFDVALALILVTSTAMLTNFKYITMPKISFATKSDGAMSIWITLVILGCIFYPDEVFFPVGIIYLLSGPVVYVSVPAYNFMFHREHTR